MHREWSSAGSKHGLAMAGSMLVLALLLAPSAAMAQDPPPPYVLDHFRCYPLLLGPAPGPAGAVPPLVELQDQFDVFLGIEERVFVLSPKRFCNPVVKRIPTRTGPPDDTLIDDPNAHLTMYPLKDSLIHRPVGWNVVISNQFGTQRLHVRRARILAVPTHKIEDDLTFPDRLDHFKCYESYGKEIERRVFLADQFETAQVVVLDPKLFCNPVEKTDPAGNVHEPESPDSHLTCYDLIEVPTGPFSFVTVEFRDIRNQFTPAGTIEAYTDEDLLCVPTRKVSFSAIGEISGLKEVTGD